MFRALGLHELLPREADLVAHQHRAAPRGLQLHVVVRERRPDQLNQERRDARDVEVLVLLDPSPGLTLKGDAVDDGIERIASDGETDVPLGVEQLEALEVEVEQRAREKFPNARPRIISDNGPQFIAKEFIRIAGMTHVRISPHNPQSNGKIERWHKTLKGDAIRVATPGSVEQARRVVERFVDHYNGVRLHSAIGDITPNDFLAGRAKSIWAERDRKLEAAREARRLRRAERAAA